MKYLLDTHALIWALTETGKLSKTVKSILVNSNDQIIVSTISFWEISLKIFIGKAGSRWPFTTTIPRRKSRNWF
jgi:PIN domain nuclease of toxin-antitoxin system